MNIEPMKPRRGRKFRKETKYTHHRSEGLTTRRNGGSFLQPDPLTPVLKHEWRVTS